MKRFYGKLWSGGLSLRPVTRTGTVEMTAQILTIDEGGFELTVKHSHTNKDYPYLVSLRRITHLGNGKKEDLVDVMIPSSAP